MTHFRSFFQRGMASIKGRFRTLSKMAGDFTVGARQLLLVHVVQGVIVSVLAGFLAALIAGENKRAPLILGVLLSGSLWAL